MAQPLQSINLVAPAFKGVNTEDSPIAQDPSYACLLYTSPSPRDLSTSRMPSSA